MATKKAIPLVATDAKTARAPKPRKPRTTGRPVGRPTKLDPERVRVLLNALRLGNPLKTAAMFAKIDDETLRNWTNAGRAASDIPPAERTATQRKMAEFFGSIQTATVEANVRAQGTVHQSFTMPLVDADGNIASPEQQRVILESAKFQLRMRGDGYSEHSRTEITGKDGGPIDVKADAMDVLKKLRAIAEARGSDDAEE